MDDAALVHEARLADPDRALCALFAPRPVRPELSGLILLDHELARIPGLVTQPLAGMIRYQWWRDSVEELAERSASPVPALAALVPAIRRGAIDTDALRALIDAREHELGEVRPTDLAALEAYLASTAGEVSRLMARCVGAVAERLTAATEIGTAWGLVRIARAFEEEAQARELAAEPTALLDRAEALLRIAGQRLGRPPRAELRTFLPGAYRPDAGDRIAPPPRRRAGHAATTAHGGSGIALGVGDAAGVVCRRESGLFPLVRRPVIGLL